MKRSRGFTIIELLIAIAIVAILATLATPSFRDYIDKSHVRGATEAIYEQLQYARSQSLKRSVPIIVNFSANNTSTWHLGITDKSAGCDAEDTIADDKPCTIEYDNDPSKDFDNADADNDEDTGGDDLVLVRLNGADFSNVTMKGSTGISPSFTGTPGSCITANPEEACFEPIRGLSRETVTTGHIELSKGSYTLQVRVDKVGGVEVCYTGKYFAGYDKCL
jgi:prepilin-type N-terminal cleavage/methylation domain-containing protein